MKVPDWKTCTEEQMWKYVAHHLASENIDSVLVGGAVVAIYSKGAYRSGDLDFVCYESTAVLESVLSKIGFKKQGRYYAHPECSHLFIDFVSGHQWVSEMI